MGQAADHQVIDTLGASPKGQYVAVEEYGYRRGTHRYYVSIRIINVWTKKYVGQPIFAETEAHRPNYLGKVRAQARAQARPQLTFYEISL